MSKPEEDIASASDEGGEPARGPSLMYSLIALALAAAIGFALMIVFPFYHRR